MLAFGMAITLADPYLKTARAKEHLKVLRKELSSFYESKPYQFSTQEDRKNRRYRIRCEIKDTPDKIPLILGDALYCLRASLDHLVWCLASLTTDYPQGTQFPILSHRDPESSARFSRYTAGVPADAVKIIETLQPYNCPNSNSIKAHKLWRLNLLGNIDKHRRIPVHSSSVVFMLPEAIVRVAEFEDDGVVCIPFAKVPRNTKVNRNPDVSFNVVFGDSHEGIESDIDGVEEIYDFVTNNAIPRFAGFFK